MAAKKYKTAKAQGFPQGWGSRPTNIVYLGMCLAEPRSLVKTDVPGTNEPHHCLGRSSRQMLLGQMSHTTAGHCPHQKPTLATAASHAGPHLLPSAKIAIGICVTSCEDIRQYPACPVQQRCWQAGQLVLLASGQRCVGQ